MALCNGSCAAQACRCGDGATRPKFTTQPRTPLASFHTEWSSPLKRCKDASYDCERSYRAGLQQTRHRHAQRHYEPDAIHDSREHKAAQACAGAHARIMTSTQTSEEHYSTVQVACHCVELLHSWSTGTNRSPTAILLQALYMPGPMGHHPVVTHTSTKYFKYLCTYPANRIGYSS